MLAVIVVKTWQKKKTDTLIRVNCRRNSTNSVQSMNVCGICGSFEFLSIKKFLTLTFVFKNKS